MDRKFYVLGSRPGLVPILKQSPIPSVDCALTTAEDMMAIHQGAVFTLLEVLPNGEVFARSVTELLRIRGYGY